MTFECEQTIGIFLLYKKVVKFSFTQQKIFWVLDSDSKRIRQKFYQFFINEKFKKILNFFICILPNYVPHEITKEF